MKAEIMSIGTELLLGQIVNTNESYIAGRLADLGISVHRQTTVGDNAERLKEAFERALKDADMVFITAGMGGGTGTGAAPVISRVAREHGALTVAVVTKPFDFEGKRKMLIAEEGIEKLLKKMEYLVAEFNELNEQDKDLPLEQRFASSMIMAIRPWRPTVFERFRRDNLVF